MKAIMLRLSPVALAASLAICAGTAHGETQPGGAGAKGAAPAEPIAWFRALFAKERPPSAVAPADAGKKSVASRGIASFYAVRTNGTRTASGVPLKDSVSTAAHRSLPFGTWVRVKNLKNGLSETVVITDRGPFIKGRIIDVSRNAAERLSMVGCGIVPVEIEVLAEKPASRGPGLAGN